jgi:PAS domain S-box-containing protein
MTLCRRMAHAVPLPATETARLAALRDLGLLDTPAEERFDRLTRLACLTFKVPIALVSLVDAERQWFKSRQGLEVCETGRDVAFCAHAILQAELLVVEDARADPRFADNPLVTGAPHIRFYAGAPLSTANGHRIGTLCLIDTQPRLFDESRRRALRDLADAVQDEIGALEDASLRAMSALNEERFRLMADGAPALIWTADVHHRRVWFNRRWCAFTGRRVEQELGSGWLEGVHADDRARCAATQAEAVAARRPFELDYRLRRGDGSHGWVAESGVPFSDRHGHFIGYIGYCWDISASKQAEDALRRQQRLGEAIARALSEFLEAPDRHSAFDGLLVDVLALTASEYGFIGEVLRDEAGQPYLKTHAITNIAWDEATRQFYDRHAPGGMEFRNLDTLFGAALRSGTVVIANDPARDPRRGGLPPGHPGMSAFLGIPVHHGGDLIALLGLGNRPGGYDEGVVEFLRPLLLTLGQLVDASRSKRRHAQDQAVLARLSQVAAQTTNGVVITDCAGRIEWINDGFTRLTGYRLEEIIGRRPADFLQGPGTDLATVASMAAGLRGEAGFDVDVLNYTRDKQPYWVRISCSPLRNADGALQGFMAIESDISRERADAAAIRASERRLAAVIEGTGIGTWEWNVQSGETQFNERWADIVGYTLAELAPVSIDTWLRLVHPDDALVSAQLLEQTFRRQRDHYDCQCRMRHKQGHWVWVHDRGRVHSWTADGKPLLMAGTHADITERKHAERALARSEARLRGLFALSPVGIALNDFESGRFLEVNDALLAASGYTRDEFLALDYWDITPSDYAEQEAVQRRALEASGRYGPYEKEYLRRDGSRYPVLLNGTLVHDDNGRRLIWSIIEDMTERKRVERMKSEFVSTVSHELRTPLTSISGALGLLASGALGPLPEAVQPLLEVAQKNSKRLGLLINDLLDMEKLMAGKMALSLEAAPLPALLATALRDNQPYAATRGITLVLRGAVPEVAVLVDLHRLQQVLANLLSNAIKFSPPGAEVEVSAQRHAEGVRVAVRDHGPGVPAAFRARIFQKFAQADASDTRSKSGTGLGLAISRELVERMGGQLGFDSVEGQGASFHVDLPVVAASPG